MATNSRIRSAGLTYAKEYFRKNQIKINVVKHEGYDFSIEYKEKIYFILVKSTSGKTFTSRWLEPKQVEFCNNNKSNFLLVLVSGSPYNCEIYGIFSGNDLDDRKGNIVCHQYYELRDPFMTDIYDLNLWLK